MGDRVAVALVAVALRLGAPAMAGPFEDGDAAARRGDYATALRLWRPLAERGDTYARFNIGLMYFNGHGAARDHAEAIRRWRPIASRGDALAQFSLGFMYDNGHGVTEDVAEAPHGYRLAAAQVSLGLMYYNGRGVPQDHGLAHRWFALAAAQGGDVADGLREMVAAKMTQERIAEAEPGSRDTRNLVARRKP